MPPKSPKNKKNRDGLTDQKDASPNSESSIDLMNKDTKPKKQKPMSKKEKEKIRKMEKEMKEALIQLRKEADAALAEFKAMQEASERKAKAELFEHNRRVELLAGTCENFKMAKARLLHENNKLRDAEIWERYITTDRKPYPENVPDMHNHLYLWQQSKESEYMEFALSKCDSYVDTLTKLDELIEYPLYSTSATISNWKELRREWREEFLYKIDKACFNMIKNLSKNFNQEPNQSHIFSFDYEEEHVKLGMCAYVEYKTQQVVRLSPKVRFSTVNAEIVMPAAYRTNPFILRMVHLDQDFFSDSSLTYYCPEGLPMEPDLLKEIHRCFEAKKEAKSLVADREREKVRQAKQKVLEAQAAANQAEKSFQTFQQQTSDPVKRRESRVSLSSATPTEGVKEQKKKKAKPDIILISASESSINSPSGQKRPRGIMEESDGESMAKSLMHSTGTKKALDVISMKSGMRKRHDRTKKTIMSSSIAEPEPTSIFWTHSMLSLSQRFPKVEVRRASEMCFEEAEDTMSKIGLSDHDEDSYDSLDLMFGRGDDDEFPKIHPLRQLIKDTVIVDREANRQQRAKSTASISYDGKKGRRRGKSNANATQKARGITEDDEVQQTASDIFDSAEEMRQEHYMSSLLFPSIPHKRFHINLREYSIIGGTYLLDIIFHELQPHTLRNGNTVQIFYGEMNIKRDDYKYDYKPPPPREPDEDEDEPVLDTGLQHLLHVKLPLPKDVFILDPPIVALWDQELKYWTKENVYKADIDVESNSASFSMGRVRPFAFFQKKYFILPFDSWNMKPKLDTGGVMLSLQGLRANFEFHILGFEVCLSRAETAEGGSILQLADISGQFMHLHKLIAIMKSRGVNIFPDEDAFLYTQSSCKDVVLEDHTYMSMAMFADTLEFLSCELNTDFKRRKLAFRVRECLAYNLELRYRTVVATTLSAQIYRLGLEDASFDETKHETSYGFCPDVNYLLEKAFAHVSAAAPLNPLQVLIVYNLLSRIKVFSYCGVMHLDKSVSSTDGSKRSIRKRVKKGLKQKHAVKSLKSRSSNQSVSLVPSYNSEI